MLNRFTLIIALFHIASLASTFAQAGTVSGKVNLAKEQLRAKRPFHVSGFVTRSENSIRPAKRLDPRPEIVVVLQTAQTNKAPPAKGKKSSYRIVGEGFETPIKPVQVGTVVEIVNQSSQTLSLHSKENPGFVPADPINPKGRRKTTATTEHSKVILIEEARKSHLKGRVIAFPHPYFSTVKDGKFSIANVPDGLWTVKLWYQDSYVTLSKPLKINVSSKPTSADIQIPARIKKTK